MLLGNPNVGKSVLFGALTGHYVTVSNYPGTTVELTSAWMRAEGGPLRVTDTPGANSFLPTSEDERVTRDILLAGVGAAIAVGDAKNLERTLVLALQLCEMGPPFVLCLNMMDEARARGITVDHRALAHRLGVDVVPSVAIRREGVPRLRRAIGEPRSGGHRTPYPAAVERAIARLEPFLGDAAVAPRALALMTVCGGEEVLGRSGIAATDELRRVLVSIRRELEVELDQPAAYVVAEARLREARRLAGEVASRREGGASHRLRAVRSRLERAAIHPVWGIPILAGVLWLAYQFVGVLGAGTLVDLLEDRLFGGVINPLAIAAADRFIPWAILRDLLVGEYGLITMALTYSLALVLPIVGTFFIAFGILEDSGYLPRLAVMVHRVFKKIGLNGKAVLPMVLGLGCDTMATLTTRILETRKERLIVILLLALGVPCSAQLTVVLMMLGSLSAGAMAIWAGVVVGVLLLVGALAARVLPGKGGDFVLELPPLRVPAARNIAVKTLARIEWYLKEAVPLFVLGTLVLFVADRMGLLPGLQRATAPVLKGMLGLPEGTAEAFIVGFLRRDFGAAGLYHMAEAGQLDAVQVVVAVVTITLFIPCIANFFMMVKEQGWKVGVAIAAFVFPFALAVGALLNWSLRALGVTL